MFSPAGRDVQQVCLELDVQTAAVTLRRWHLNAAEALAILCNNETCLIGPGRTTVPLIKHDGTATVMDVYVPEVNTGKRLGATVFLHGAGSNGGHVAKMISALGDLSTSAILCPTATIPTTRSDNFELAGPLGNHLRHPRWEYTVDDFPMIALSWARRHLNADSNRCAVAGHSMGAVATWNLAARFWAALSAAAPINGALSIWERFGPDEEAAAMLPNLLNLPIHSVHGISDVRIPIHLERETISVLQRAGHRDAEVIGVSGGCHSLESMNMVIGSPHFDNLGSWLGLQYRNDWPRIVSHRALHPSHGRAHWVEIKKLTNPRKPGEIVARVLGSHTIQIFTKGVAELLLHLHHRLLATGELMIIVNGNIHRHQFSPNIETFVASYQATVDTSMVAEDLVLVDVSDHKVSTPQVI